MGVVYLGERADGEFEQQVAIKIVRERLARPELIQRFVSERKILARLDHPNIARLIDGGTTDDGLPYVVMEYVEGACVDDYCTRHSLSVARRLELFLGICEAVHYAHRNLVVHRDLKPSNVLVTDAGVPKLLDFGIARLLDTSEQEAPLTRTGTRAMTPMYASPEQIRGAPVTSASDVYSLGVLLYELLTGRRPYGPADSTQGEIERLVCESDPELPSTVAGRGDTHAVVSRELSGDLDNIVMKAMRKEPERRYGSALELAEDIRRHLSGHPVAARPATVGYRLARFVARNRALSVALAALSVALIGGAIVAGTFAVRASRMLTVAEREAAVSRAISDFLNVDVLAQADPYLETDREITLRAVVDRAAARVAGRFADRPLVEAGVRATLARTYLNLGDLDVAEEQYRQAVRLMSEQLGDSNVQVLENLNGLVGVLYDKGEYDQAEAILIDVQGRAERTLPADHPVALTTLDNLAEVLDAQGRVDEAISTSRRAVAAHQNALGRDHPDTLTAMNNLALMYEDQDRFDESEPLLIEVLEARRRVLGVENPDTLLSMASLGFHFVLTKRHDRAEELLRETVETGSGVLGLLHPWQLNHEMLLADLYRAIENYPEAEAMYASVLERQRESLGMDSPYTLRTLLGLAGIYGATDRIDESEAAYAEVIERRRTAYGDFHRATLSARRSLAAALVKAGESDRVLEGLAGPVGRVALRGPRAQPVSRGLAGRLRPLSRRGGTHR